MLWASTVTPCGGSLTKMWPHITTEMAYTHLREGILSIYTDKFYDTA